jgi:hypothetical protein
MLTDPRLSRLAVLVLLISTAVISRDITAEHFPAYLPGQSNPTTATIAQ